MQRDDIKISGEPNISQIIHHNQPGQEYLNTHDKTLWRVTQITGDTVHIHCVNGWERLIQETVPPKDASGSRARYFHAKLQREYRARQPKS